jgi:ABC-2 type transport system permease protein
MKLYGKFFVIHLKSQMQYKTSFFFTTLGQFLVAFAMFLSINFLFARFESVGGFSYEEVLISFSVIMMSFATASLAGRSFETFPAMLGNGNFDRILVRPRNVVFQVMAAQIQFSRFGRFAQAVVVLVYAIPRSGIDWTWDKILTLVLMIFCGTLLFFALFVTYASFSFFTTEGLEFMNVLIHGGQEHGRLPFGVYGDGVLKFLTFVVPLALVQYYPLLYLTGRENAFFFALSPVFALLFLVPCYLFFRFGLRHYKSTGS